MMWDHVMERVLQVIAADPVLTSIFGTSVRMAGTGDQTIPGIEYTVIGDTEGELWEPLVVQFDLWTTTAPDARAAERRMKALWHRALPIMLDGVQFWAIYTDGSMLATPDRSNYTGRGLRFRLTPLREQYAICI